MNIDQFDLRATETREYWIQLRVGDKLLFCDMEKSERPLRVKVASIAKQGVEDAIKAVTRAGRMMNAAEAQLVQANRQQRVELEKRMDEIERTSEGALTRFLTTAIVDWDNLERDGKLLPYSKEALDDLSAKGAPLYRMALEIAGDAAIAMDPFTVAATD